MPRPAVAPMKKPSMVSSRVTPRWTKISPVQNQSTMAQRILIGSPKKNAAWLSRSKKNGGTIPGVVKACHNSTSPAKTANCRLRNRISGDLLLLIGLQHFFLHGAPDLLVKVEEGRRHADLGHVARPGKVDLEVADWTRTGPGGEDQDAIGKRDRLLEVVSDEQHRL